VARTTERIADPAESTRVNLGRVRVRDDAAHGDGRQARALATPARSSSRTIALAGRLAQTARAHWLLLLLLGAGLALRVVVSVAYDPALLRPDSVAYLRVAGEPPEPWRFHPIGYPLFLRLLPFEWTIAVVPVAQHLLGMAIAVLLYAVLLRLGVRLWLAALGVAPFLLDAYELNIEQYVLSETLFHALLVGACAVLLWRRPLSMRAAALAGLLMSAAALTRTIGVVAIPPALVAAPFLAGGLPSRARLLRSVVMVAVFAAPLLGYAAWFAAVEGTFTLTTHGGRFLYGRVAPFADCTKFSVPESERALCPTEPPGERPGANDILWGRTSPVERLEVPEGVRRFAVAGDFAKRVIRNQPLDYLEAVGSDFVRVFGPVRAHERDDVPLSRWKFQRAYRDPGDPDWSEQRSSDLRNVYDVKRAEPGLARFLASYQRFGYAWGPLLAAALLLVLAAVAGVGRAAGSGLRAATFLLAGTGVVLALGSTAVTIFSWRYQLPLVVLLPPAGALAITALFIGRKSDV
jgi:hypothetical protein